MIIAWKNIIIYDVHKWTNFCTALKYCIEYFWCLSLKRFEFPRYAFEGYVWLNYISNLLSGKTHNRFNWKKWQELKKAMLAMLWVEAMWTISKPIKHFRPNSGELWNYRTLLTSHSLNFVNKITSIKVKLMLLFLFISKLVSKLTFLFFDLPKEVQVLEQRFRHNFTIMVKILID